MSRYRCWAAVAAIVGVAITACDSTVSRGPLVIGETTDVGVLLPTVETSAFDAEINSQLYLGLNSARWESGSIEYLIDERSLAERWQLGPDSTTLHYDLRSDAVWSDGQPIDAGDVVFTYELIRRPEIASPHIDSWEHLDSVVALGDRRVAFYFDRRYPGMLFDTGVGIIPEHALAGAATDNATLAGHAALADPAGNLVVSGPYQVAEWSRGERLVLESNPTAFTPGPVIDTVIFRFLPDQVTRLIELENGMIDLARSIPMTRAEELSADARLRIETIDDRFYDYIAWNPARIEPFADREVRRALSLAIDRQAIIDALGITPFASPAAGPYPPIFSKVADPSLEPDPHLADSARAILASRGWSDTDGDDILDKDGRPFRFTLLTQAGNQRRSSAAQVIQAGYAEIGVDMEIRLVEFNTLLGLIFETRDFEAVLLGWQVALEPNYLVGQFWPPDHPFNITGYASSVLDELIPAAQDAATADEAAPIWREAARVIADDRPYAFLWFFDEAVAVNERVKGTRIDTYGLYQNLYQWRLEP